MSTFSVKSFFDEKTATYTHVLMDTATKKTAVIDSVWNYNAASGELATESADLVRQFLIDEACDVEWILETHIHADHLTAAHYFKDHFPHAKIGIGAGIRDVLTYWVPLFNTGDDTPLDARQFDHVFEEGEQCHLGQTTFTVWFTPGHTPACSSYVLDGAVFVGDTIFMPDVGTARTDFPGGSAATLYHSIQRLFSLPDDTVIYHGHDYPMEGRDPSSMSLVRDQKERNILISARVTESDYVAHRHARDQGKPVPTLILPSLQVNMRAGGLGHAASNGTHYIKIPLTQT